MVLQIRYDKFKYQVILFGLTNISAIFQGYINKILAEKLNIFIIVYYNNVTTWPSHLIQYITSSE